MKDLTKGNIYKTFFLFGAPMVLSGLLSQMYSIIDTAIAGKMIGEVALSATGVTSPLTTFLSAVYWGFGSGFSIYVAKLFGAREYRKIRCVVAFSIVIQLVFSLVMTAFCLGGQNLIFNWLKVGEEIRGEAFSYYSVYVSGLLLIVGNNFFNSIFNALGISGFQLIMSLLSTALNVGGNVLFVKLGMGVMGLAIASVVSSGIVDAICVLKLRSCYRELGIAKEKVALSNSSIKEASAYFFPNMAQQMVMYLSSLLLSPMVNGLGCEAAAAYSVTLTIFNLTSSVFCNSSKALSNYSAQCMGLKDYHKIKKGIPVGALQAVAFSLPFILTCAVFSNQVCSLFFKSDASEITKEYAVLFARVYVPLMFLYGANNLFHNLFRGVKASVCLFSSTFFGTAVRYVASALLIGKYGMNGFYLGWAISWAAETTYVLILFFANAWNPLKGKNKNLSEIR